MESKTKTRLYRNMAFEGSLARCMQGCIGFDSSLMEKHMDKEGKLGIYGVKRG